MNALKAHERHQMYLAEQERQLERKLEEERIAAMTDDELIEYRKQQEAQHRRILKDMADAAAVYAMLSSHPYR